MSGENETPKEPTEAQKMAILGTACFFEFKDASDRNLKMIWPGSLPRKGETLKLAGRDIIWKIVDIEWQIQIEVKEGKCERGVIIRLEKE